MGDEAGLQISLAQQAAEQVGKSVRDHECGDFWRCAEADCHGDFAQKAADPAKGRAGKESARRAEDRVRRIHELGSIAQSYSVANLERDPLFLGIRRTFLRFFLARARL